MCKLKKYKSSNVRIDKCIKEFIMRLNLFINKDYRIIASCCGHKKYPMTILVKDKYTNVFDLVSGEIIPRTRNFYKRDKQGYYYIPEVLKCQ